MFSKNKRKETLPKGAGSFFKNVNFASKSLNCLKVLKNHKKEPGHFRHWLFFLNESLPLYLSFGI